MEKHQTGDFCCSGSSRKKCRENVTKKMKSLFLSVVILVSRSFSVSAKTRTTDAFMSSADLQNIFKLEQGLVNSLRKYKAQLDKSLYDINHYVREVDELYKNENCYPPDQCEDHNLQARIVSNPIYNYQMLKRLLVYWKIMEDNIKEIDIKSKSNPFRFCVLFYF